MATKSTPTLDFKFQLDALRKAQQEVQDPLPISYVDFALLFAFAQRHISYVRLTHIYISEYLVRTAEVPPQAKLNPNDVLNYLERIALAGLIEGTPEIGYKMNPQTTELLCTNITSISTASLEESVITAISEFRHTRSNKLI